MAIELATAYVTLTTSGRGIRDSVSRDLSGVTGDADAAGREAGNRFGAGMGRGAQTGLPDSRGRYVQDLRRR